MRIQAIEQGLTSCAIPPIRLRAEHGTCLLNSRGGVDLAKRSKTFSRLGCQDTRTIPEELLETAVANLRLAKVDRVEQAPLPLQIRECLQEHVLAIANVDEIPDGTKDI